MSNNLHYAPKYQFMLFEGPDGAGKTTATAELTKMLTDSGYDLLWQHAKGTSGLPPGLSMLDYHHNQVSKAIRHLKSARNAVSILDRGCISEIIYANVFRNGPSYDAELMWSFMLTAGCQLVVFLPPIEVAWKSAVEKKEPFTELQYGRIWEAYYAISKQPGVIRYDYTKNGPEVLINE